MKSPPISPQAGARAFSLIELLIVIAIVALLMTAAVPALQNASAANNLTSAADNLANRLSFAQQEAMRTNRPVQIRFQSYNDPKIPGSDFRYRAYQLMRRPGYDLNAKEQGRDDAPVVTAISGLQKFPTGIVISNNRAFSNVMNLPEQSGSIPRSFGGDLTTRYVAFEFLADGSTNLATSETLWYVTLMNENREPRGSGAPPENYACITIDPFNGSVKILRP